ncbi:hypothetical protein Q7C36_007518 [Tachysurus vachellii]|uniref:Uncharacterized protein n=1 Tax=Tachysurus vachellii TaxID=175792 RepID=A0AA88T344_TACVA|nr:hypothetical protein Q7C36_007518 [Tachysurus vachellii]
MERTPIILPFDCSKVTYIISLLSGKVKLRATPEREHQSAASFSFHTFSSVSQVLSATELPGRPELVSDRDGLLRFSGLWYVLLTELLSSLYIIVVTVCGSPVLTYSGSVQN